MVKLRALLTAVFGSAMLTGCAAMAVLDCHNLVKQKVPDSPQVFPFVLQYTEAGARKEIRDAVHCSLYPAAYADRCDQSIVWKRRLSQRAGDPILLERNGARISYLPPTCEQLTAGKVPSRPRELPVLLIRNGLSEPLGPARLQREFAIGHVQFTLTPETPETP